MDGMNGILSVDALESSFWERLPVVFLFLAALEEIHHDLARLVAVIRIDVESGLSVHDDLRRSSMAGCKRGQPAHHCLHHSQTKALVQCWLKFTEDTFKASMTCEHGLHL